MLAEDVELYVLNSETFSAIVIKCVVPETISMSFDNAQELIDSWHTNMPDNAGLIIAETCMTAKRRPMVYFIVKHGLERWCAYGK